MATRPGSMEEVPVTLAVYPVRRSGTTSVLNLLITSTDEKGRFSLRRSLNDHNPEVSASNNTAPDAIRLIDGLNQKAYLAATTGGGDCLCSPATGSVVPVRESSWWVSVTYAAPPAAVTVVDVVIPGFGTVSGVPVV